MSPVKSGVTGYWLRRLGWLAKGEGLGRKSKTLILPPALAARLGTDRTAELVVRFPYNKIGLPGEVEFPYTEPHVFPTFYRLQVPRKPRSPQDRVTRPICCLGDGEWVFYRRADLVSTPGFDQDVHRSHPIRVPCVRGENGPAPQCPFAVPTNRGQEPPCKLVGELHLLIPYPLPDDPTQRGVELGVYVLEVPPSRISDVLGQLSVLRELAGGQLTGHDFRLVWEATRVGRNTFYAPRFEMTVPPYYATADQASGVEEDAVAESARAGAEELVAESEEEAVAAAQEPVEQSRPAASVAEQGGAEIQAALLARFDALHASFQGLNTAPGTALPGQQQNIQAGLTALSLAGSPSPVELLGKLRGSPCAALSAAQAAALVALVTGITKSPEDVRALQGWWSAVAGN